MLKKAIGFHLGMRGDLCMATVAARSFKENYPDYKLIMGVGKQYSDMLPLFYQHPYFDNFHIYNGYNNWPDKEDQKYLVDAKYDIVFNGMPQHSTNQWYKFVHQYEETVLMCNLPVPKNIKPFLNPWFKIDKIPKNVAFCPFAGYYNPNNDKRLSQYKAEIIAKFLNQNGYNVIHLGGDDEPKIPKTDKFSASYFDSVKIMLGCDFIIHTDTGMGHIAGAYNFPRLGLFSDAYYKQDGQNYIKNIIPLNDHNSIDLSDNNVNDIPDELIFQKIEEFIKN